MVAKLGCHPMVSYTLVVKETPILALRRRLERILESALRRNV